MHLIPPPHSTICENVRLALEEDIGSGDVTARLVDAEKIIRARMVLKEPATVCGRPWVDEVFRQIDQRVSLEWSAQEGDLLATEVVVANVSGPATALLSGERTALNFLQTLSGTASQTAAFVKAVSTTDCKIVDTRKTVPGLRLAQKYAVRCGGGVNHRIGLYDGILIKENHIAAAGGIKNAIVRARGLNAGVPLMTEAENLQEVDEALNAAVDLLLVDEFDTGMLREAVTRVRKHRASGGKTLLEYSGSACLKNVQAIAECGVDRISVGSLTKHVRAIDLSMRFQE